MSKKKEVLYVGIDLGTSRSAISTSQGENHLVESYVGWPRDLVARKVLKKEILVGREALEKRPMLDLHRPLERGLIKEGSEREEEAVRELLKFLFALVDADAAGGEVRAVVGVPAEAMRVNKQTMREVMQGLVKNLMIVSEPFAVAYGLDALLHTLIIDVGAGTADFCVMNGRYPTEEDQRTLTQAGDYIDEQLLELVHGSYPDADVTIHMIRDWKEKHGFVGDSKKKITVTAPVHGKPTKLDITAELRTACESLVAPITETMLDLLARVEPEFQETVRDNVVLTGGSGLIDGLDRVLEAALIDETGNGKVKVIKDPLFVGSKGGLEIAVDAPDEDWETLGV